MARAFAFLDSFLLPALTSAIVPACGVAAQKLGMPKQHFLAWVIHHLTTLTEVLEEENKKELERMEAEAGSSAPAGKKRKAGE